MPDLTVRLLDLRPVCVGLVLVGLGALAGEAGAQGREAPGPEAEAVAVERGLGAPGAGVGKPTVVTLAKVPERHDRDFLDALRADLSDDLDEALQRYGRARRMGGCREESRCAWQAKLTRQIREAREAVLMAPGEAQSHKALAIICANKLVALRIDTGQVARGLYLAARREYHIARDLAPPSQQGGVLLGLAALHGEAGDTDRARVVFKGVRIAELESPTALGNLAYFYTTIGELDLAFSALERALEADRPANLYRGWVKTSDDYHRVREHPRFKELLDLY